jgi:predicted transcriptional regulator
MRITIVPMRKGNLVADDAEPVSLAEMTVEIVSAYVAHNQVAASDLPKVISTVAGELRTLGRGPQTAMPNRPEPAVSVRRSVRPDHLVCLVCGKKQKLIKRHLAVEHELTPNEYRETFGLKPDYPMAAPNYAQQRRELAVKIGLGRPKKQRGGRRSTARPKAPKPS